MDAKETEFAIKQRVQQVFAECKITVNRFAILSGLNQKTINDQINGTAKIGAVTLSALLAYRPDLSAEWLLRGTGDMLITNKPMEINIDNSNRGHHNNIGSGTQTNNSGDTEMWKKIIAEKDAQIAELKADKERLYQLLLKQ